MSLRLAGVQNAAAGWAKDQLGGMTCVLLLRRRQNGATGAAGVIGDFGYGHAAS